MFAELAPSMSLTDFGTSSDWSPGAFAPIAFSVRCGPMASMSDAEDADDALLVALVAELERLGLDISALPDFAVGDAPAFLEQLRGLAPGVSWHDVCPDLR